MAAGPECAWCGSAGPLRQPGRTWKVVRRKEWDGAAYHEPCRDAEQRVRSGVGLGLGQGDRRRR
jgi:hypothetical protein